MVNWSEKSLTDDEKNNRAVFCGTLEAKKEGLPVHVCLYTLAHLLSIHTCCQGPICVEGSLDPIKLFLQYP